MLQTLNFYSDSRFHIGSKGSAGAPSPRRHSPRHFLSFYRLLTSHALAFGLGRLAICLVVGQQQLPQDVQIASQNPQTHVTLIARFVAIPTSTRPFWHGHSLTHEPRFRQNLVFLCLRHLPPAYDVSAPRQRISQSNLAVIITLTMHLD